MSLRWSTKVLILCCVAMGTASAQGATSTRAEVVADLVRDFVEALPDERARAEAALRAAGSAAIEPLLARLESADPSAQLPPRVVDFVFEVAPAGVSKRLATLLGGDRVDTATRTRLINWLARRDVDSVRDHEVERAEALLTFLGSGDELAMLAARGLASYDLPIVARGLAERVHTLVEGFGSRDLILVCARSFAGLRAAGAEAEALFTYCEGAAPWVAPTLMPAFRRLPARVLLGRLDPWCRSPVPAVAAAFDRLIVDLDRDLHTGLEHERRVQLFERFRRVDPRNSEWALRAAHAALMDVGEAKLAREPLDALARRELETSDAAVEAAVLEAVADYFEEQVEGHVAGASARAWMRRARELAERAFEAEQQTGGPSSRFGIADVEYEYQRRWRSLLKPALGADEVELRRRRFVSEGGLQGSAFRAKGRRLLATLLVAAIFHVLEDDSLEAARCFEAVRDVVETLEAEWDFAASGEPGDLEAAIFLRCGPSEVLERALEGNEAMKRRSDPAAFEARRGAARKAFRALVEGLHAVLPARVLPLPGMPRGDRASANGRERAYLDVTGAYARFLHRLGDQSEAAAIYESLIHDLDAAGLWSNRRAWAGYLFDHAGIEIDRRRADGAKASLEKYIAYYEESLRDVRQAPERYVDPGAAEAFFASRLATGHISMAVLHNVVLAQVDIARDHCRKAYALEDSPFNRVLYACYLARDKKFAEAATLLQSVDPSPPLYYNMACTYALSGQKDHALEHLALDLTWNHATEKARNRQREWARNDHDLESLRGDARFEELVRTR